MKLLATQWQRVETVQLSVMKEKQAKFYLINENTNSKSWEPKVAGTEVEMEDMVMVGAQIRRALRNPFWYSKSFNVNSKWLSQSHLTQVEAADQAG